jgi:hypothetical protein
MNHQKDLELLFVSSIDAFGKPNRTKIMNIEQYFCEGSTPIVRLKKCELNRSYDIVFFTYPFNKNNDVSIDYAVRDVHGSELSEGFDNNTSLSGKIVWPFVFFNKDQFVKCKILNNKVRPQIVTVMIFRSGALNDNFFFDSRTTTKKKFDSFLSNHYIDVIHNKTFLFLNKKLPVKSSFNFCW